MIDDRIPQTMAMQQLQGSGASELVKRRHLHADDHGDIVKRLRLHADDPMWADHAEISKTVLTKAADRIEALEAALRDIMMDVEITTPVREFARATLAPEQKK